MDELKTAKIVILMLSKKSVQRPWVNFEAGAAWTRDIVTIPICFKDLRKANFPNHIQAFRLLTFHRMGMMSIWRSRLHTIWGLKNRLHACARLYLLLAAKNIGESAKLSRSRMIDCKMSLRN